MVRELMLARDTAEIHIPEAPSSPHTPKEPLITSPEDDDEEKEEEEEESWRALARKLGLDVEDLERSFSERRKRVYSKMQQRLSPDLSMDSELFSRLLNVAVQNYLWFRTPVDQRTDKEAPWQRLCTDEERKNLMLLDELPRLVYDWLKHYKVAFTGQGFRLWDLLSQLPFTLSSVIEIQKIQVDNDAQDGSYHSVLAVARTEEERDLLMTPSLELKAWLAFLLMHPELAERNKQHDLTLNLSEYHEAWTFGLPQKDQSFQHNQSVLSVPHSTSAWRQRKRPAALSDNMYTNLENAGALFVVCDPGTRDLISNLQKLFHAWRYWDQAVKGQIQATYTAYAGLLVGADSNLLVPPRHCAQLAQLLGQSLYEEKLESVHPKAGPAVREKYAALQKVLQELCEAVSLEKWKEIKGTDTADHAPHYSLARTCAYYAHQSTQSVPVAVTMLLNDVVQGFNEVLKLGFNYFAERHLLSDPAAKKLSERERDPEKKVWRSELYYLLVQKEFMEESKRAEAYRKQAAKQEQELGDEAVPELEEEKSDGGGATDKDPHTDWVPVSSSPDPQDEDPDAEPDLSPLPSPPSGPLLQRQVSSRDVPP